MDLLPRENMDSSNTLKNIDTQLNSQDIRLSNPTFLQLNYYPELGQSPQIMAESRLSEISPLGSSTPMFTSNLSTSFGCTASITEVLVKVLREYLSQIPLDDFYNFLYTPKGQVARLPIDGIKLHRAIFTESGNEGLNLCKETLGNLLLPKINGYSDENPGDYLRPSIMNKHELLRIFLAIKIIFDAVEIVEYSARSDIFLLRTSIYNAYYIICKKLSQKYRTSSNSSDLQYDIILSLSKFGKVFRLNFPNLKASRLGRRGNSKFSYRGMTWNRLLIDEDIKALSELHISDIESHFKPKIQKNRKESEFQLVNSARKPLYSFIDLSNQFPGSYCALRIWKIIPGNLPQQSQWSTETMQKSMEALKYYGIDISASIIHLHSERFSPESISWFLEDVLQKIRILMGNFACDEAYLHLYLVVTLLISPIIFASDHELDINSKPKLSTYLTNFAERLEFEFFDLSLLNRNNIMGFAKIVRKMISCIKVLLSYLPTSLAKRTARTIGYGYQISKEPVLANYLEKIASEIIHRAVITACNALNWEFAEESLRSDLEYRADLIQKLTAPYLDYTKKVLSCSGISLTEIDNLNHPTYELSLHIFCDLMRIFHDVFMTDQFALQLPIKLIELMVNSTVNEFQTTAFHTYGELDPEISKEMFKVWWIYATASQGYMSIFCEIVALSMRVS